MCERARISIPRFVSALLLVAATLFAAAPRASAAPTWRPVGAPFSDIIAVGVAPWQPGTLFISRPAGIYRSLDAGATWTLVLSTLPSASCSLIPASAFFADPTRPGTLYAVFGIDLAVTYDAGNTWQVSPGTGTAGILGATIVSGNPESLYLATATITVPVDPQPPCVSVGALGGLIVSQNAGATWSSVTLNPSGVLNLESITALASDPEVPGRLFFGGATSNGAQIFFTDDGGRTPLALPVLPTADPVQEILLDPSTTYSSLYVVASAIYRAPSAPGPPGSLPPTIPVGIKQWTQLTPPPGQSAFGGNLLRDPTVPGTLYSFSPSGILVSPDGGDQWNALNAGLSPSSVSAMAVDPRPNGPLYAVTPTGLFALDRATCVETGTDACLNQYRFQATLIYTLPGGTPTTANALPLTDDTTGFWFTGANDLELMVKILDGTAINGDYWVFGGSLTNLAFTLTLTDRTTGNVKTYTNPAGQLASFADVSAFPQGAPPDARRAPLAAGARAAATPATAASLARAAAEHPATPALATGTTRAARTTAAATQGACTRGPATLCLDGNRFQVDVTFQAGTLAGAGQAVPVTDGTGTFWFVSSDNLELMIKVLDGTAINGHLWVFYGALSDVDYTVTVTDTQTGAVKTYHNPQGQLASVADTSAF